MNDDANAQNLVVKRTFAAPPSVVWGLWTDPSHFAAWYGPEGATVTVITMDVRVGGSRLLRMEVATPDGARQMWFRGQYLQVVPHRLLVYTDAMSDESGADLSHEMSRSAAEHPTSTEVRVELEAVDGGTAMTLVHVGIPADSPGAVGWGMALDALEDLVRQVAAP